MQIRKSAIVDLEIATVTPDPRTAEISAGRIDDLALSYGQRSARPNLDRASRGITDRKTLKRCADRFLRFGSAASPTRCGKIHDGGCGTRLRTYDESLSTKIDSSSVDATCNHNFIATCGCINRTLDVWELCWYEQHRAKGT
jgi:hypothetical protein